VQDENQRAASLGAGGGEMHGRTTGHDDMRPSCAPDHLAFRRLDHLLAGRLIPVLLDWEVKGGPPVNVLFRPNQRRTPRVRLFLDFVTELLRDIEPEIGSSAEAPHWHRRGYRRASSVLRRHG